MANKRQSLAVHGSTLNGFSQLLGEVKLRIQSAQTRAVASVNAELVRLYWDIGRMIDERQKREGWGASVIPRLATGLKNELPELKGFSERNLKLMVQFSHEYPRAFAPLDAIGQPSVAQIPWAHNVLLMQRVKDASAREWYLGETLAKGWTRNLLALAIDGRLHERQGKAITNFAQHLPSPQSDLAQQTLKDPYIFDFLTLAEPFHA